MNHDERLRAYNEYLADFIEQRTEEALNMARAASGVYDEQYQAIARRMCAIDVEGREPGEPQP